jgi:hypothetical protein
MSESATQFRGVIRNGVVVLEPNAKLAEGTEVEVKITPIPFTPEERAEFEAWERLSDEAWAQIDWGEGEIARDSG